MLEEWNRFCEVCLLLGWKPVFTIAGGGCCISIRELNMIYVQIVFDEEKFTRSDKKDDEWCEELTKKALKLIKKRAERYKKNKKRTEFELDIYSYVT